MTPELIAATLAAVILVLYRYRKQIAEVIYTCHMALKDR